MKMTIKEKLEAAKLAIEICKTIRRERIEKLVQNHAEMSSQEMAFEIESHREDDVRLAKAVGIGVIRKEALEAISEPSPYSQDLPEDFNY